MRSDPAAGCPSSQPPSAMLWDREHHLERVKACIILHIKSLFLGPCQTGRAEDHAGRRTRHWHLNVLEGFAAIVAFSCLQLPCHEAHIPGQEWLCSWGGQVAQAGGRAALPAGDMEGTMLLEPEHQWLCSSRARPCQPEAAQVRGQPRVLPQGQKK